MKHNKDNDTQMSHESMDHSQMSHHNHMHMDHSHMSHEHGEMDHSMHGHGHGMGHMGNMKQKLWLSLLLAIPVILMSPMMDLPLFFQFEFPGSQWLVAILSTVLYFYGGSPFLLGAKDEIKSKSPAMMTLIAMGISVAYFYSLYSVFANQFFHQHTMNFFFELATLIVIMIAGHWIEMNATMQANNALDNLSKLLPEKAQLVDEHGHAHDVLLSEVKENQTLMIKAGETIPADGVITKGTTQVNEFLVTGESKAVAKEAGETVIGGSTNEDGTIFVQVTGVGNSGYLSKIKQLVMDAQQNKSKVETLADKVAGWLFYAAILVGLVAFVSWLFFGTVSNAVLVLVTVLVIACPHALGLAIPLVTARFTSLSAVNGLLIKNRDVIELTSQIDYIALDKTGTLTDGKFEVAHFESLSDDITKESALAIASALESQSSHPVAKSIVKFATDQQIHFDAPEEVSAIKGVGLSGIVSGKTYQIVSKSYLDQHNLSVDAGSYQNLAAQGLTVSYLIADHEVLAVVATGDKIKPEAKSFIEKLKAQNITPVMLTGDNALTAQKVADQLGITEVQAQLLPQDKLDYIHQLHHKGHRVMMIGDGINDAPTLAASDIGVAIGSGTDVAIDAADVVLTSQSLDKVLALFELTKLTKRKMMENLWWGAGYNILALPLAAGILAPIGFMLNPAVGAILMSLSTIIVAINAMTLKFKA
ncbi:copper-translocating P-type ATPase [Holzapfeliella floricola]|uniref:P-type Cu(+) transporter n=1 Tax=Holzapfeliella floricola DSM 23037 = JCM 16512 TaxID=1423744 RepID=A0A0R2DWD3_9LACO|nr:copper-translocating P-type ATPase [Holzapfeliella floricola]KRN04500.1 hypothetical protein FC86_GL000177 [Holzapfeliella floricola DSM 23037 = JCM 16512]